MADENSNDLIELATELTIAWLGNPNNRAAAEDVPAFLQTMHTTVSELVGGVSGQDTKASQDEIPEYVPAVTARKSLASKDHIISLIDGKPYRTLRRHLSTNGLTPAEYRERFKLKPDYPMVAPSYSQQRSEMAKKIGLGSKGRSDLATKSGPLETTDVIAAASAAVSARRGRKRAANATETG